MANLNFPSNPYVGQTYTIGNRTWIWNGNGWQIQSGITSFDPLTANRVIVTTSTNSTSTNSGGLIVYGGAGIGEDLYVGGDIYGDHNLTITNVVSILGTATSTSTTTGALTVVGGVGIQGALYASSLFDQGSRVVTLQTLGNYGVTSLTAGTDTAISSSTGAVTIWNTSTLQTVTDRGNSTTNTILISNITQSNSTSSGALRVAGGIGVGGNLYVNNTASVENIIAGTGYVRDLSVNTFIVNAIFTSTDNVNSTSTNSGAIVVAGGVGIGQDVYVGGTINANTVTAVVSVNAVTVNATTVTASLLTSYNLNVNSTSTMGNILPQSNGHYNLGSPTQRWGTLYISSSTIDIGGLTITTFNNVLQLPQSNVYSTTSSTGTSSGALTIAGGVGIGGTLYSSNLFAGNNSAYISLLPSSNLILGGDNSMSIGNGGYGAVNINPNALVQIGSNGFNINLVGSTTTVSSTAVSISTTTGAVIIAGGVGIGGNLYGYAIYDQGSRVITQASLGSFGVTSLRAGTDTVVSTATGDVIVWNTSTFDSITQRGSYTNQVIAFNNTLQSNTYTQGALTVAGGVGIAGNLNVGGSTAIFGNLQVFGTATYIDSTISYVTDPIIELGGGKDGTSILANDGYDRGIVFHYSTTATSNISYTNNAFFGMDNATQTLMFKTNVLQGVPFLPSTSGFLNLGNYGSAIFGGLTLVNTTTSISTTSGALVVGGGIGAGGDLNLFGNIFAGADLSLTGNYPTVTITDTNTSTGAPSFHPAFVLNFQDGSLISRFKLLTTGSITSLLIDNSPRLQLTTATTYIYSTAQAYSTTTGALVVTGGAGIQGNIYAQNIYSNGSPVITQGTLGQQGLTALYAGTDTAVNTNTGVVTVWNTSTLATVTGRGNATSSTVYFNANVESTAVNTGSVIVNGGLGVSGNIYAGAVYDHNSRVITRETAVLYVVTQVQAGTDISVNTTTGIVVVSDTSTLQSVSGRGNSTTNVILVNTSTISTGTSSGALVVAGGVGIGGSLNVGNGGFINNGLLVNTYAGINTNLSGLTNEVDFVNLNTSSGISFEWRQYQTGTTSTVLMDLLPSGQLNVFGSIYGASVYSGGAQVLTTSSIGSYGVTKITTGTGISISPSSGVGQVNITSIATLQNVTDNGSTTTNAIGIWSYVTATSTTTGALTVIGGVGIGGSVFIGGTETSSAIVTGAILNTGTLVVNGTATFTSIVAATSPLSGAVTIAGGLGVNGSIYSGQGVYDRGQRVVTTVLPTAGTGTNVTIISSTGTTATFSINNTGVLSITAGTDTVVSTSTGNITVWDNSTLESVTSRGAISDRIITLNNGQDATSSTYATLIVSGGVGISKNLVVGGNTAIYGNLQVFGTQTFVNSTQTYIVDPVIELGGAVGNTALSVNDGYDRGLILHYSTTSTADTTYDNHSFLGMDNATQVLVYKTNVYPGGTETYTPSFANTGTFGLAKFGGLTLVGGTQSTSTFTGDLIVAGGVGVGGNVNVAGNLTVNGQNVLTGGGGGGGGGYVANIVAGTDTAVSTSSGVITIWNTSTFDSITSRGSSTHQIITILNSTNAISPTSGALQVVGGLGVGSDAYFAGRIVTQNSNNSISSLTGALVVTGGAGIGGNVFISGALTATSAVIAGSNATIYLPTTGGIYNEGVSGTQVLQITTNNLGQGVGLWTAGASYNTVFSSGGLNFSTNATITSRGTPTTGTIAVSIDLSGNLFAKSKTESLDTGSGALVVAGGAGISGNAHIGGNTYVQATTVSTGSSNGALVVSGGVGIAGNTFINGNDVTAGSGASTRGVVGSKIFANGSFATPGDAQAGIYVLRRSITGSAFTNLTTDNSSPVTVNQLIMPDNSTYAFTMLVSARSVTSSDEGAWQFDGVISRYNGAGTTILRVVNKTKIWASVSAWDCQVIADSSNGGLIIQGKGDGANTIRFVANVQTSEVTN